MNEYSVRCHHEHAAISKFSFDICTYICEPYLISLIVPIEMFICLFYLSFHFIVCRQAKYFSHLITVKNQCSTTHLLVLHNNII